MIMEVKKRSCKYLKANLFQIYNIYKTQKIIKEKNKTGACLNIFFKQI